MKNLKFIYTFLVLIICNACAFAQNCDVSFLGTKALYPEPVKKKSYVVPAGYQPVFINHVGRHGARHLTKNVNTSFAYRFLQKADSAKVLTAVGQRLKKMVLLLDSVEKGNVKSISGEGRAELQGIGQRMALQNKSLFSGNVNLNVAHTKEVRTKQSADAFLLGFKKQLSGSPAINEYQDDIDLRFFDASPAYSKFEEQGAWSPLMASLQKAKRITQLNQAFVSRIFKPVFGKTVSPDQAEQFTSDVFGFATIVYSLPVEIAKAGLKVADLDFKSAFTCDELERLGKVDVADDFFKKGPGTDVNGIQVRVAVPLLVNFINTTDDFIKDGHFTAQLRFAHAETIAPFAALLGICIADKATTDISRIDVDWRPSVVAPLSSNIQWVLYKKSGSNNYLVKVLLNEREVHITGLKTQTYPYYKWADLKSFYQKKLKDWGVKLDGNMQDYLQQIAE